MRDNISEYDNMKRLNREVREKIIEHVKEVLNGYCIDTSKYIFKCSMDEDRVTATVECRVRGHHLTIWMDEIFFNEKTGDILQSGKLYLD